MRNALFLTLSLALLPAPIFAQEPVPSLEAAVTSFRGGFGTIDVRELRDAAEATKLAFNRDASGQPFASHNEYTDVGEHPGAYLATAEDLGLPPPSFGTRGQPSPSWLEEHPIVSPVVEYRVEHTRRILARVRELESYELGLASAQEQLQTQLERSGGKENEYTAVTRRGIAEREQQLHKTAQFGPVFIAPGQLPLGAPLLTMQDGALAYKQLQKRIEAARAPYLQGRSDPYTEALFKLYDPLWQLLESGDLEAAGKEADRLHLFFLPRAIREVVRTRTNDWPLLVVAGEAEGDGSRITRLPSPPAAWSERHHIDGQQYAIDFRPATSGHLFVSTTALNTNQDTSFVLLDRSRQESVTSPRDPSRVLRWKKELEEGSPDRAVTIGQSWKLEANTPYRLFVYRTTSWDVNLKLSARPKPRGESKSILEKAERWPGTYTSDALHGLQIKIEFDGERLSAALGAPEQWTTLDHAVAGDDTLRLFLPESNRLQYWETRMSEDLRELEVILFATTEEGDRTINLGEFTLDRL